MWRSRCELRPRRAAPGRRAADGVVLLQFPTMEAAKAWYYSPAYQEALVHRLRASDSRVVLVEGLA